MSDGANLIEPVREFLSAPLCAVLATIGADGAPRQIVIHYTLHADHLRLNGRADRLWVRRLDRDPRVALIVHDPEDYLHYVSIRGRTRVVADGAVALDDAMEQATRYGEDPESFAGQARVGIRLDPVAVHDYR